MLIIRRSGRFENGGDSMKFIRKIVGLTRKFIASAQPKDKSIRSFTFPEPGGEELGQLNSSLDPALERINDFHDDWTLLQPTILSQSLGRAVPSNGRIRNRLDRLIIRNQWSSTFLSHLRADLLETGFWVNSIFCSADGNGSYFHWHRNFLTHLVFLLDRGFTDVRVVVEDRPPQYKLDTLSALGLLPEQLVPVSEVSSKVLETLLSTRGVESHSGKVHDFVRPSVLRKLSDSVRSFYNIDRDTQKSRLYVKRGRVADRRITNEVEVENLLCKSFGFKAINASLLSFREQVALFGQAETIIGMHGGGLTNSLYSRGAQVLEIASIGHGLRPDFFPFVRAAGGRLSLLGLESISPENDVSVPLGRLEYWLTTSKPETNEAFVFRGVGAT